MKLGLSYVAASFELGFLSFMLAFYLLKQHATLYFELCYTDK